MRALIDGDVLVYRTAFAGQQTLYSAVPHGCKDAVLEDMENLTALRNGLLTLGIPEEDVVVRKSVVLDSVANVFHSLRKQVEKIHELSTCGQHRIFLTGSGNYRERLAVSAPYKGNRLQDKPEYYEAVRDRLLNKFGAVMCTGYEADDAMALQGTAEQAVICSIDKDLRQVPGLHLDWTKDTSPAYVSPEHGARWLFVQSICGDATDNIPGLYGIGKKKAADYLATAAPHGCSWDELADAALAKYAAVYSQEEAAERFIETFNLVYLCRTEEELSAQQAARQGHPGVSPWTAYPAGTYMSSVRSND